MKSWFNLARKNRKIDGLTFDNKNRLPFGKGYKAFTLNGKIRSGRNVRCLAHIESLHKSGVSKEDNANSRCKKDV
ncbi:hypothetical protein Leryth_021034 [Lithospermum erythrorhizon]|nr:hypothetical protein Leryth_021034 [Lithospermum erythrorhizon]